MAFVLGEVQARKPSRIADLDGCLDEHLDAEFIMVTVLGSSFEREKHYDHSEFHV